MPEEHPMTLGEQRVRLTFNPGGHALVEEIKSKAAELIDLCEARRRGASGGEEIRCWSLGMTAFEDGAMWAVKAATSPAS